MEPLYTHTHMLDLDFHCILLTSYQHTNTLSVPWQWGVSRLMPDLTASLNISMIYKTGLPNSLCVCVKLYLK